MSTQQLTPADPRRRAGTVTARVVTDRLAQIWGQQVLILNRPGAGGLIALQALATARRGSTDV